MRIAVVSQVYDRVLPPKQNSVGIWTYEVARRLGQRHEVAVVSRESRGRPRRSEDVSVMPVTCLPMRFWNAAARLHDRLAPGAGPAFSSAHYCRDYVLQAIRRLRSFEPDVLHVHNFAAHLPAFRRAFPDAAIVLHMHCDWLAQLDRDAVARGISAADLVVGCSGHVTEAARLRFPDLPVGFAVLSNGTTLDEGRSRERPHGGTVLFVGRISPEKGLHVLLQAWPRVVAAHPYARLELVGPTAATPRDLLVDLSADSDVRDLARFYGGPGRGAPDYARQLRESLPEKLRGSVTFAGPMSHAQVLARYREADLLVNPSLSEAFGMSLVEAMARETPVVAVRSGGMTEIVEATGGGLLVRKNDADDLADAIVALLGDPAARARMGRLARERVAELYSWDRVAARAGLLHRQAIERRAATGGGPGPSALNGPAMQHLSGKRCE